MLKVDGGLGYEEDFGSTEQISNAFRELENLGFDGVMVAELAHDPFLPLSLAAHCTDHVALRTAVAVAFARNPLNLAHIGHDLNAYSKGRFTLGIGSQIKPHITRRFGMPWHSPAQQMKEFIVCMHAIWDNWYEGTPLNFTGDYYQSSLMTPEFTPRNTHFGRPKVTLAAVGPLMTEVAATVADGIVFHTFNTEKYMRETLLPRIESGLEASSKCRDDFEIFYPPFIVTGSNEEEFNRSKQHIKYRIAFYASTPAYIPVLACHGWEGIHGTLNGLSKEGKWDAMASLISDEMLETFACVGEPLDIAHKVRNRYGDIADRVTIESKLEKQLIIQQLKILKQ